PMCRMVLAEVDAYKGAAEKAGREIPELLRFAEQAGFWPFSHDLNHSLAVLELSCGDPDASWRQVAPLFADFEEMDPLLARLAGSVAIEALIAIGDLPEAERLLALLDEIAARTDTALGPLSGRCRGLLLAAPGDREGPITA